MVNHAANHRSDGKVLPSSFRPMLISVVGTATLLFTLCFVFEPRWETNDDVAMSMVAHGYGGAATGSPNIVFSNVLWGHVVRSIPELNGALGYSIVTLCVLFLIGVVVTYGLSRLGLGHLASFSALILILARPILFPQFTINAGLLMVVAIVCWHLYARQSDKRALVAGCLLAFCSYLERSLEFLLVLIVASPLMPWRALLVHRASRFALFVLGSAVALSAVIDHQAYQGHEWKRFNELNFARAPFTDFRAGERLRQRPDILERHGYSLNDIDLISEGFFVDPSIANPKALKAMTDELGLLRASGKHAFTNAWVAMQGFWHPQLIVSVLAALVLAVLRPNWQVAASWGLCIAAALALGWLGRPAVLRVYVPVVALLVIAPFLRSQAMDRRHHLEASVLLVAAIVNTSAVLIDTRRFQAEREVIRQGLIDFPSYPVVAWGGQFPFEAVFSTLTVQSSARSYQLYGLGVLTLAPYSVASAEERAGRGFIQLLSGESGLPIVAHEQHIAKLEIYCEERLHGQLKEISAEQHGQVRISRLRCDRSPAGRTSS